MMNKPEVCTAVNALVSDCVIKQEKFLAAQKEILDQFYARPYGNEEDGKSSVVTTEISDLVNADMSSLARMFLGSGDVVEFMPNSEDPADIQEARDKQTYVGYILETSDNAYREQSAALKSAELYPVAAMEYGMEEKMVSEVKRFKGLDEDEVALYVTSFEEEDGVESVSITLSDADSGNDVEFKLKRKVSKPFIRNVPIDVLLLSSGASSKDEAPCVGKEWTKSRGDLVADGYSREEVSKLSKSDGTASVVQDARFFDQGGTDDHKTIQEWASEMVTGVDVNVLLDEDDDGILERRHIIKSGDTVLTDEVVDHVPYAIGSAELMPDSLVGRGRATLVQTHQRVNTFLTRGIINNIGKVNNPRTVARKGPQGVSGVNMDDLLDDREGGVVRTDGLPNQDVVPLTVPYIGDAVMQVQAGFDAKAAQSTGNQIANQALTSDQLHQETATRFQGIERANLAKIELVARNLAETLWTELYEGLAWLVSRFQDSEQEIYVMGRQMVVDPSAWRYDHKIRAVVGTGAGDDSKTLESLLTILQLQIQAIDKQSSLSDEAKVYNTLSKMTKAMGQHTPSEFFNDPQQPEEALMAQVGILTQQVQELATQLEQKNPLAEVELIKNQDKEKQREFDAVMKVKDEELEKLKMQIQALEAQTDDSIKLTELELKYGQDVPGSVV